MRATSDFLANLPPTTQYDNTYHRRLELLHSGDHLDRLIQAGLESETVLIGAEVSEAMTRLVPELQAVIEYLQSAEATNEDDAKLLVRHLAEASARQAEKRRTHRTQLLEQTARGALLPDEVNSQLVAMCWVDRVGYHTWRTVYHLLAEVHADAEHRAEVYAEAETEEM